MSTCSVGANMILRTGAPICQVLSGQASFHRTITGNNRYKLCLCLAIQTFIHKLFQSSSQFSVLPDQLHAKSFATVRCRWDPALLIYINDANWIYGFYNIYHCPFYCNKYFLEKLSFFFDFLRENLRHNKSMLTTVSTCLIVSITSQQDLPTPMTSLMRIRLEMEGGDGTARTIIKEGVGWEYLLTRKGWKY